MNVLDYELAEFTELMRSKLIAVAYKHGGLESPNSVTSDNFDWCSNETASAIREHLLREIGEWLLAKDSNASQKELVDIGNCAFILCAMSRKGAI